MNYNLPNHFSHKLELKTDKLPTKVSDRTNWRILFPGIFFGTILLFLGVYELLNGFKHTKSTFDDLVAIGDVSDYEPLINPVFFDIIFIIIGLGIIIAGVASYIRYKKIFLDKKSVSVVYRSVMGSKVSWKENFNNYQGIRFRIEFFQFGFLNRNRYIIELYHKDAQKIIPLYISTSNKDIRKIWERYARELNLPALMDTEDGIAGREVKNLDRSIKEMADLGYIVDEYDTYASLPTTIAYARKKDKIVLKARKIVWDAYNIMAWIAISIIAVMVAIASLNFASFKQNFSAETFTTMSVSAITVIVIAVFILFRKEKLVLKKDKIVNTHKYMLFSTKHDEIPKNEIETIEITLNPSSGRYYVSIISDEKTITFGAKLPIDDLRWVKKFLIHEVIR